MLACGSSSNRVTDSVVGYVPGGGNTVGEFSIGPEPCGSGGPNWACRGRGPPRSAILTNAIIETERRAALFKVSLLKLWLAILLCTTFRNRVYKTRNFPEFLPSHQPDNGSSRRKVCMLSNHPHT